MIRAVVLALLLFVWTPAEAAFSLVANTGAMSSNGGVSVTTPAINTTGATLIIINTAQIYSTSTAPTDSKSNVWIPLNASTNSSACRSQLYYAVNPAVGSGHTFTLNPGAGSYPSITMAAFSGGTATLDFLRGSTSTTATASPGSITPYESNELLIAAACHDGLYTGAIDSSFAITDDEQGSGSNAYGNTMAYLIQGAASAVNPTFSGNGSSHNWATKIAAFRLGGPITRTLTLADCTTGLLLDAHDSAANNPASPDTIQLPSCSVTWTGNAQLFKSLIIKGAGDSTIICDNYAAGSILESFLSAGQTLRLSAIQFTNCLGGGNSVLPLIGIYGPPGSSPPYVRIDHLTFSQIRRGHIMHVFDVLGVADNLTFQSAGNDLITQPFLFGHYYWAGGVGGHGSFTAPTDFGVVDKAFYVEKVTYLGVGQGMSFADAHQGARIALRKNTIVDSSQIVHGTETGGSPRGNRLLEFYANTLTYTGGYDFGSSIAIRGGTALVFNNTNTYVTSTNGPYLVPVVNRRNSSIYTTWAGCDGAGPYDDNDGTVYATGTAQSWSPYVLTVNGSPGWTLDQWARTPTLVYSVRNLSQLWGNGYPKSSHIVTSTSNTLTLQYGQSTGFDVTFNPGDSWEIRVARKCVDQPGSGQSDPLTGDPGTPPGWVHNALEPMYVFNNSHAGAAWGYGEVNPTGQFAGLDGNRDWYSTVDPLNPWCSTSAPIGNGTCGVGVGTRAQMNVITTCTQGVGFWVTDEGEWDSTHAGADGRLYKCDALNNWVLFYTPYTYPHPLRTSGVLADEPTNVRGGLSLPFRK